MTVIEILAEVRKRKAELEPVCKQAKHDANEIIYQELLRQLDDIESFILAGDREPKRFWKVERDGWFMKQDAPCRWLHFEDGDTFANEKDAKNVASDYTGAKAREYIYEEAK